jgi:hypothetical protein
MEKGEHNQPFFALGINRHPFLATDPAEGLHVKRRTIATWQRVNLGG